ncbi:MAG: rRNA ((1915)-N(3))-methyltransferase RlmH [Bacteroidota bacterium]|jgi:23S rRNA (pseudouridine1915-N3)-methyltransferase
MKITLLVVGKTTDKYLIEGIEKYTKRLIHYCKFQIVEIPELKNTKSLSEEQQKEKEAELIAQKITATDHVILLDEQGKQFTSVEFSKEINKWMNQSVSSVVFVIGGPYGFDQKIKNRANAEISLSKMTFSHQMVRLFFVEQIYRAYSILKGEPYHHS